MLPVDLHVHSNRSDGTYSPRELVDYAMKKGLAAFALTDHDTVEGLAEAMERAESLRRGQAEGLQQTADNTEGFRQAQTTEQAEGFRQAQTAEQAEGFRQAQATERAAGLQQERAQSLQQAQDAGAGVPQPDLARPMVPEVIPGIEFSTKYTAPGTSRTDEEEGRNARGQEVHIVGLDIDYQNPAFRARLQEFVDSRTARNHKMCRLLQEAGMDVTYEALLAESPDAVITRAHYARYMLNHGYVKSMAEAFDRYIGDRCPCYVPREKVTPVQAVRLILEAGGIPVLAHPILYRMSDARLEALTAELKDAGLIGIEAIYSTYKPHEERQIRALAKKYDLRISGGSDFHGTNKPGLDLGTGCGTLFVPYEVLTDLRKRQSESFAEPQNPTKQNFR